MANKVYVAPETAVRWLVSGGDEAIDLGGAGGNADGVAVGSYHDWGSGSHSGLYQWWVDVDGFDSAPVVGDSIDVYVTQSRDATLWDGPEAPNDTNAGTGDTDRLKNLLYLGSGIVHSTSVTDHVVASGVAFIPARYFAPVVHNNTADKFESSGDAHEVVFVPIPDEIQ